KRRLHLRHSIPKRQAFFSRPAEWANEFSLYLARAGDSPAHLWHVCQSAGGCVDEFQRSSRKYFAQRSRIPGVLLHPRSPGRNGHADVFLHPGVFRTPEVIARPAVATTTTESRTFACEAAPNLPAFPTN